MKYLITLLTLLQISNLVAQGRPSIDELFKEAVEVQRKTIFLGVKLTDTILPKYAESQVTSLGLQLMHEQLDLQASLEERLSENQGNLKTFLNLLEDSKELWDVDKLGFLELLENLINAGIKSKRLNERAESDMKALYQIHDLYEKEMTSVFGQFGKRGMEVQRKNWDGYVMFLFENYTWDSVLKEYGCELGHVETGESYSRSSSKSIWGYRLPPKTVVLTFDDGPHYKNTPAVLEVLKKKDVPAVFFVVGDNVGVKNEKGEYVARSASKYSKQIKDDPNFLLGNHSKSHQLLTKLDSNQINREVSEGFDALQKVVKDQTTLFRPPYGGVNGMVRKVLIEHDSRPYMWNIDSRDWADPVPSSIANRVVEEVEKQGRGVILMHDIHQKTVESLGMMIDTLKAKGYEFVLWDGEQVLNKKEVAARGESTEATAGVSENLYRKKWALVIGINEYENWPQLKYAVNDAQGIKDVLVDKLEFKEDNIVLIKDKEATRKGILEAFGDHLINNEKVKKDDAVFVFYAGHGMTRRVNEHKSLGYIVPVDGDNSSYSSQVISMSEIEDLNEMIPAKHVFWVMDACYSGLALTRGASRTSSTSRYIKEVTSRQARQIITAGGANEEVADGGPHGHSIFTWTLINGLSGDADLNGDGYITASEVCNYVPPYVSSISNQTPAYGNLVGSSGGDFIFQLKVNEGDLSASSEQHDDETTKLLNEIAELKAKLAQMEGDSSSSDITSRSVSNDSIVESRPLGVGELNSLGLKAYRQKDYQQALAYFRKAVDINPSAIQPLNNMGFMYYKFQNYDEAEFWIKRVLEINPQRLVAYLNLADIYLALDRVEDAIENYEMYLSIGKESEFKEELRVKVVKLKKG